MKSETFLSHSSEQTLQFACQWAKQLDRGSVIVLVGPLGAGKTVFTKGVAHGLGVEELVNSPTFVLVNEYQGQMPLYHLDLYRADTDAQADSIGYEEYLDPDGVTLIEWGEKIKNSLPKKAIWVEFEILGEKGRKIIIKGKNQ